MPGNPICVWSQPLNKDTQAVHRRPACGCRSQRGQGSWGPSQASLCQSVFPLRPCFNFAGQSGCKAECRLGGKDVKGIVCLACPVPLRPPWRASTGRPPGCKKARHEIPIKLSGTRLYLRSFQGREGPRPLPSALCPWHLASERQSWNFIPGMSQSKVHSLSPLPYHAGST